MNIEDKIKGCLIGGAVGDALGYPVEFMNYGEIINKYGQRGISHYDTDYAWLSTPIQDAQVSDDTQMTLYTAEAILKSSDSQEEILDNIRKAYIIWMSLQTGYTPNFHINLEISKIKELNQRRAPGMTCLSALQAINEGREVFNNSKGCGSIMRIAPIGILGAVKGWDKDFCNSCSHNRTMSLAADVAKITHCHDLSTYSSAMCAEIIRRCLLEESITVEKFTEIVKESFDYLIPMVCTKNHNWEVLKREIDRAFKFLDDPREDWQIIESELGGGWVAEETLSIAIFCVARHINDFNACLVAAVNHSGDSDSTGAVAGNILGAIIGFNKIPSSFLYKLQNLSFIEKIADLFTKL